MRSLACLELIKVAQVRLLLDSTCNIASFLELFEVGERAVVILSEFEIVPAHEISLFEV